MVETAPTHTTSPAPRRRPRLGFAGVGWIGRARLEALSASGLVEVAAIADTTPTALIAAAAHAPDAAAVKTFEELLALELDGVVIATPNALHADEAVAALRAGLAVFCQKPLARNGAETRAVIAAAEQADRLLGVDLSYRHTTGLREIKRTIETGELGEIYAIELAFHNAYGPDKPWFYEPTLAGGGCLLDLGVHLVDAALWTLGFPEVESATAHLLTKGHPRRDAREVEDYAAGQLVTSAGVSVQLACSWHAPAGCDARIEATWFGTKGGACFRNVNGSFYDFVAERLRPDRTREPLATARENWGGRAAVAWARQLATSRRFHSAIKPVQLVADTLDRLYGREA